MEDHDIERIVNNKSINGVKLEEILNEPTYNELAKNFSILGLDRNEWDKVYRYIKRQIPCPIEPTPPISSYDDDPDDDDDKSNLNDQEQEHNRQESEITKYQSLTDLESSMNTTEYKV